MTESTMTSSKSVKPDLAQTYDRCTLIHALHLTDYLYIDLRRLVMTHQAKTQK